MRRLTHILETGRALARRRASSEGHEFVNRVLVGADYRAVGETEYRDLVDECRSDGPLRAQWEAHLDLINSHAPPSKRHASWEDRWNYAGGRMEANAAIFYAIPRIMRPNQVVETGVHTGSMTALLLTALNRNSSGKLTSIDLPSDVSGTEDWPIGDKIGVLVPDPYRARWELRLGDATVELPAVLSEQGTDLFFHDSDHSLPHMLFELALATKFECRVMIVDDLLLHERPLLTALAALGWSVHRHRLAPNVAVATRKRDA